MKQAHRFSGPGQPYEGLTRLGGRGPTWTGEVRLVPEKLADPLRWRKPSRVFVNSMSDLFHEDVPDEFIASVFGVMALAGQHTFQVLTKRADRMARWFASNDLGECLASLRDNPALIRNGHESLADRIAALEAMRARIGTSKLSWPLSNVWLGVSCEDQATADERIPELLECPAAVRWVSAEPLLGPMDLTPWLYRSDMRCLECGVVRQVTNEDAAAHYCPCPADQPDICMSRIGPALAWIVAGGESGPGARPMHPDWARSLRDQCQTSGASYFFKQWGEWCPDGQHMPYLRDVIGGRGDHASRALFPDGKHLPDLTGRGENGDGSIRIFRLGKKASGRLLDGREWNEFPATCAPAEAAP